MLLSRLWPSHCADAGDALRRAADLHEKSRLEVAVAARKACNRASDMRVVADAAEERARARGVVPAIEDALMAPGFGGSGSREDQC